LAAAKAILRLIAVVQVGQSSFVNASMSACIVWTASGVTPVGDHLTDATDLTFDTLKSADYALGGLVMRLLHDFPPVELGYETGVHGQQTPESGQIFHEH